MKPVIHIIDSLGLGGCQTCLKALVEHAAGPRRHWVISLRQVSPAVEINGAPGWCAPSPSRFSLRPLGHLIRLARELGDPILHCYLFRAQVFGLAVKRLLPRTRLILHEGGRVVQGEHEPRWERAAYRQFLRVARGSTDVFLANSRYILSRLEAAGHHGRLPSQVVYNCILTDTPVIDPIRRELARARLGLRPGSSAIGFAGRLVERKGWRDFLGCAEHFREHREITWLIAGSGSEQPLVEQAIAERRLDQVRLLGFQSDMDSFYRALDLCVVPSHWEPHGLVQIEAQGRGVPVIATRVPGMAETVCDGVDAILVEPRSPPELIAAIGRLLASAELRERLATGALENALRFTIGRYEEQLESCYSLL